MNPPTTRSLAVLFLVLAMGSALYSLARSGGGHGGRMYRNDGHAGSVESNAHGMKLDAAQSIHIDAPFRQDGGFNAVAGDPPRVKAGHSAAAL
jgi:hypothetical protein